MKESIKNRIDAVRRGEVPEGYRTERAMLFPNEWGDPVTLNTVLTENKDRNEDLHFGKEDVLSVSGEQGIINQIDLLGRSYAGESVAAYHVVETGDVVYTKSPLKENPYGIIKQNHGVPGIVSTLYAVYHCNSPITGQYLENYFSIDTCLNNYLKPLVKRGAKNDMKVNNEDVLLGRIPLPSLQEQERINEIIAQFDRVIELKQKLLEEVQRLKKMYLSKMFPAKGSCVPEIRFSGFTGDWEQRKLPEFVEFFSGLTYTPNDVQESGTLVLRSSNVCDGEVVDADNVYVNSDVVNSEYVQKGDIVVVVRNGSRALIGKHAQIKRFMPNTVIGAFMTGIRCDCPPFTNALLNTPAFEEEIAKNMGATINQITGYMFSKMEFLIPDLEEQQKIGEFFDGLDDLITLHQQELDCWQKKKKALTQLLLTGLVRVNA